MCGFTGHYAVHSSEEVWTDRLHHSFKFGVRRNALPCDIWQRTPQVPNVILRTLSVEAVRSMVATGMGVTILSDMVYRPWSLEGDRIDVKTLDDEVHTMDVGLAWKSKARLSPAARAFCEFVTLAYPGPESGSFRLKIRRSA